MDKNIIGKYYKFSSSYVKVISVDTIQTSGLNVLGLRYTSFYEFGGMLHITHKDCAHVDVEDFGNRFKEVPRSEVLAFIEKFV